MTKRVTTQAKFVPVFVIGLIAGCGSDPLTDLAGTYHVSNGFEPVNLLIRADGTFTLDSKSCDTGSVLDGFIARQGEALRLIRNGIGGLTLPVREVDGDLEIGFPDVVLVRKADAGAIEIDADGEILLWSPGRLCPVCERIGDIAPIAVEPCECFEAFGNLVRDVPPCD